MYMYFLNGFSCVKSYYNMINVYFMRNPDFAEYFI